MCCCWRKSLSFVVVVVVVVVVIVVDDDDAIPCASVDVGGRKGGGCDGGDGNVVVVVVMIMTMFNTVTKRGTPLPPTNQPTQPSPLSLFAQLLGVRLLQGGRPGAVPNDSLLLGKEQTPHRRTKFGSLAKRGCFHSCHHCYAPAKRAPSTPLPPPPLFSLSSLPCFIVFRCGCMSAMKTRSESKWSPKSGSRYRVCVAECHVTACFESEGSLVAGSKFLLFVCFFREEVAIPWIQSTVGTPRFASTPTPPLLSPNIGISDDAGHR